MLDRIVGPGWMATPSSLLDLMADGSHEFVLDGGSHSLAARRDPAGNIAILVVDNQGREVELRAVFDQVASYPQAVK